MDRENPRFSRDKHKISIVVEDLLQQTCYGIALKDLPRYKVD